MLGFAEGDVITSPDWHRMVHPEDLARVSAAMRDHIAGKTPMFESVHRLQAHGRGVALGHRPRLRARRRPGPAAPPDRRRARHHRAQALRGGAVPREGKRADHAAVDRRRRDHLRRARPRRVPEPGGRGADRLAARGQPRPHDRRDLPRLPRGDLRAAREPARGRGAPHPLDQVGAADAADPQGRQRALHREHGLADPRRHRHGDRRRARVPRRVASRAS